MNNPILTIYNRHAAACGSPPSLSNETSALYLGFFENQEGEQWLFTYDRRTRQATLRGGDIGWEDVRTVQDGRVHGLMLDQPELAWLKACWDAVSR